MEVFADMGEQLEAAWQAVDFDERAFPDLAVRALTGFAVHEALGNRDILRWLTAARTLPVQDDPKALFGDLPVTLYHGRRFFIQALLWHDGTTSIHRHGFSGAFQVLAGTSLHTRHGFTPRRRVSSHFILGDLQLRACSLLGRGDVEPITTDLAHALFHLDSPASTIVVRTYGEDDARPQYSYRAPGLAIDPFYGDPVASRQLQALRFVRHVDEGEHLALALGLLGHCDLHTCYLVLSEMAHGARSVGALVTPLAAARRRHGAVIDDLAAVLREEVREQRIVALRASITDPELRFFLALAASVRDPVRVATMIERRFPGVDPHARMAAWLDALPGDEQTYLESLRRS